MDSETKVTYSVIAVLIIFLGGLAYFLQPMGVKELQATASQSVVTTGNKESAIVEKTNNNQGAAPVTTNKPMENKKYTSAVITTNKGIIEITFETNKPLTVANFGNP